MGRWIYVMMNLCPRIKSFVLIIIFIKYWKDIFLKNKLSQIMKNGKCKKHKFFSCSVEVNEVIGIIPELGFIV